jgi:pilus assembly protein CpaB
MKWGIVILLILGVVAAACAAVLMGTLSLKPRAASQKPGNIQVVLASTSLPASTPITIENIDTEVVSRDEVPAGSFAKPLQVIGRYLAVPVYEGQVLTESLFVPKGSREELALKIPEGWRAFSVPITSRAKPDSILLYPGCKVDVLVEYDLGRNTAGEAYSSAMFRGLTVLAISGDSVIQDPDEEGGGKKSRSRRSGYIVTLLVEPKQAEALQLAAENGSLTMSLRNPNDKRAFALDGSVLNRGSFVKSGSRVPSTVESTSSNGDYEFGQQQWWDPNDPNGERITPDNPGGERLFQSPAPATPIRGRWEVEGILGRQKKVEEYPIPESNPENADTKK